MAGTPLTELNRPLGQDRAGPSGKPWGRWLATAAAACVGTMIIGILTSVFTAVTVSRGIATLIYGRRRKLKSLAI